MVSHFTTACLLSQNCLLFQQLPHISVSNAFNLHCFQFSFFSHFVMAKEQNSFLWNQLFNNIAISVFYRIPQTNVLPWFYK